MFAMLASLPILPDSSRGRLGGRGAGLRPPMLGLDPLGERTWWGKLDKLSAPHRDENGKAKGRDTKGSRSMSWSPQRAR